MCLTPTRLELATPISWTVAWRLASCRSAPNPSMHRASVHRTCRFDWTPPPSWPAFSRPRFIARRCLLLMKQSSLDLPTPQHLKQQQGVMTVTRIRFRQCFSRQRASSPCTSWQSAKKPKPNFDAPVVVPNPFASCRSVCKALHQSEAVRQLGSGMVQWCCGGCRAEHVCLTVCGVVATRTPCCPLSCVHAAGTAATLSQQRPNSTGCLTPSAPLWLRATPPASSWMTRRLCLMWIRRRLGQGWW